MRAKTDALYATQSEPIKGKFYRYIRTKHGDEPLSMYGAMKNGGRYNVAALFAALYLGFDRKTCEAEVSQGIAAGVAFKKGAFTAWNYDVELEAVVRLDQQELQTEIGVTESEITIPGNHWTASGIGEHLHKHGDIEALVAPSAQLPGGKCLDVYLDRVRAGSIVRPKDKLGKWP